MLNLKEALFEGDEEIDLEILKPVIETAYLAAYDAPFIMEIHPLTLQKLLTEAEQSGSPAFRNDEDSLTYMGVPVVKNTTVPATSVKFIYGPGRNRFTKVQFREDAPPWFKVEVVCPSCGGELVHVWQVCQPTQLCLVCGEVWWEALLIKAINGASEEEIQRIREQRAGTSAKK